MDTATQPPEVRAVWIRQLNDLLRIYGIGGDIILTRGVCNKGDDFIAQAFRAVADYDAFTEGNDPHGEHDFGDLTLDGESVFFKIDYYDRKKEYGSEDPADPEKTCRVMTILLAEEY